MQSEEILLAQEQSVECKRGFEREAQGTLLLTNKRLVFVAAGAGSKEEDFYRVRVPLTPIQFSPVHARFADVDDLKSIPKDRWNLSIPLDKIEFEKGRGALFSEARLQVKWTDEGGQERSAEFYADLSGRGRKKGLNDWAKVIEDLKSGKKQFKIPQNIPNTDSLEGKIFYILSDLQEKGLFEIEEDTESKFKVDLDPDEVERACESLASRGLLEKKKDSFYRLPSPLGEDDLSS